MPLETSSRPRRRSLSSDRHISAPSSSRRPSESKPNMLCADSDQNSALLNQSKQRLVSRRRMSGNSGELTKGISNQESKKNTCPMQRRSSASMCKFDTNRPGKQKRRSRSKSNSNDHSDPNKKESQGGRSHSKTADRSGPNEDTQVRQPRLKTTDPDEDLHKKEPRPKSVPRSKCMDGTELNGSGRQQGAEQTVPKSTGFAQRRARSKSTERRGSLNIDRRRRSKGVDQKALDRDQMLHDSLNRVLNKSEVSSTSESLNVTKNFDSAQVKQSQEQKELQQSSEEMRPNANSASARSSIRHSNPRDLNRESLLGGSLHDCQAHSDDEIEEPNRLTEESHYDSKPNPTHRRKEALATKRQSQPRILRRGSLPSNISQPRVPGEKDRILSHSDHNGLSKSHAPRRSSARDKSLSSRNVVGRVLRRSSLSNQISQPRGSGENDRSLSHSDHNGLSKAQARRRSSSRDKSFSSRDVVGRVLRRGSLSSQISQPRVSGENDRSDNIGLLSNTHIRRRSSSRDKSLSSRDLVGRVLRRGSLSSVSTHNSQRPGEGDSILSQSDHNGLRRRSSPRDKPFSSRDLVDTVLSTTQKGRLSGGVNLEDTAFGKEQTSLEMSLNSFYDDDSDGDDDQSCHNGNRLRAPSLERSSASPDHSEDSETSENSDCNGLYTLPAHFQENEKPRRMYCGEVLAKQTSRRELHNNQKQMPWQNRIDRRFSA